VIFLLDTSLFQDLKERPPREIFLMKRHDGTFLSRRVVVDVMTSLYPVENKPVMPEDPDDLLRWSEQEV
jgi:hypothetical protein